MSRLVEELLDATRIEAGRLRIRRGRVAVQQLVRDAVEAHRRLASASVELRAEIPDAPLEIWGDRDRLLQVLDNLIGNAVKFTDPPGRITVGATPSHDEVVFTVTDTGIGIPSDALPHLFDRFWQARTTDRQGLGLGLAIAKGIVDAHGGRIWAESELGEGTTFRFSIPVAASST